jgi:membrane protease subunit HflC
MSSRSLSVLLLLGVIALVGSSFVYVVHEYERALLLRFGQIVEKDVPPGIHFKWPVVNEPRIFDGRMLLLDMQPEDYLTQEKKRLRVDSYIIWRIADVATFYTSTGGGSERAANELLEPRVNQGLRNKFGERTVYEVVSGERERITSDLVETLNETIKQNLGLEIVDIRVKRIELPQDVSESVYERMRAERQREAQEHRSKGKELAEGIRADADRQRTVILADAYKQSELIRGEGDALAASIYAKAFSEDAGFYQFYRSLQAYRQVFSSRDDVIVVKPEGAFFEYLKQTKPR